MLRTLRQHRQPRPARVSYEVAALCAAWIVSAVDLGVNQIVFRGSGIGPGPSMGIASLVVQAGMIVFVARGSRVARTLVVVFLILATLPLQMVGRLFADGSIVSATYTLLEFALKGIATLLLFTVDAGKWFSE